MAGANVVNASIVTSYFDPTHVIGIIRDTGGFRKGRVTRAPRPNRF
jgi:hypothetical protein